jgi:hypothetical protein
LFDVEIDANNNLNLVKYTQNHKVVMSKNAPKNIKADSKIVACTVEMAKNVMTIRTKTKLPSKKQQTKRHMKKMSRFKPQPFENVLLCPFKNRILFNVQKEVMNVLGKSSSLKREEMPIITKHHTVKYKGKRHRQNWFCASLKTYNEISKTLIQYEVNFNTSLFPLGLKYHYFGNTPYFHCKDEAREYLLLNFLLHNHPDIFVSKFDASSGIQTLTLSHHGRKLDDRYSLSAHYVLCKLDKNHIVLYACNENGEGSVEKNFGIPFHIHARKLL